MGNGYIGEFLLLVPAFLLFFLLSFFTPHFPRRVGYSNESWIRARYEARHECEDIDTRNFV